MGFNGPTVLPADGVDLFDHLFAALDQGFRVAGDHIGALARRPTKNLKAGFGQGGTQFQRNHALFNVDDGIVGVGAKAHARHRFMRRVIRHVFPAAFFVAAQDQAHLALERDARHLHGFHGVQGGYGRPLVIARAAAVHLAVLDHGAKGGIVPAVTHGHDVDMS